MYLFERGCIHSVCVLVCNFPARAMLAKLDNGDAEGGDGDLHFGIVTQSQLMFRQRSNYHVASLCYLSLSPKLHPILRAKEKTGASIDTTLNLGLNEE